ncbi:hypothetical protein BN1723_018173, partial [Verticillium longisporum]
AKSNIAVVADGASTAELAKWTEQFFKSAPTASSGKLALNTTATKYHGGESRSSHTAGNAVVIAFPGSNYGSKSPELAVLAALLGGQSNIKWTSGFSLLSKAVGTSPGLKLATTNLGYSDAGLLTIQISGPAAAVRRAAEEAVKAIKSVSEGSVSKEDLAKAIAKASKQKEIQAKALQNAEDVARTKTVESASKDKDAKDVSNKSTAAASATQSTPDGRAGSRPSTSQYANSPGSGPSVRNANARQSYAPPSHHNQSYRNDRQGQHVNQQARQSLGQRLRNTEQQKMSQAPPHQQPVTPEVRVPPTGPSNSAGDSSFGRRLSGVPGHMGPKLNPNSHEFRPNP